ncbi:MAG: radical SAM protein [Sedimentisphaerales bacterium]|nr:radical SAM protein [Sedimentisphaerales bacterium]
MSQSVLLINPPIYDFAAYDFFNKPLGLLYLASFLRQHGYEVRLIDCLDRKHPEMLTRYPPGRAKANGSGKYFTRIIDKPACLAHVPRYYHRYGMPVELVAELLARQSQAHQPLAVLVSSMMTYWYPAVADTVSLVRECMPDVPVALGGIYARLMPAHARDTCRPDRLFTGTSLVDVLGWLDELAGTKRNYDHIQDEFISWPVPAYDLYEHLDYLTLITSLGCPFHCDYCASRVLQPALQQRDPDVFIEQMLALLPLLGENQEVYNIAFMDDALLARANTHIIPILQQCRQLTKYIGLQLRFYCPNGLHMRFINQEVADLMAANHFDMIRLSYESSDYAPRWQAASDDKVSDQDFKTAVNCLKKAGFRPSQLEAYILTGLPGQSMDEINQSAQVVHDLGVQVRLCQYSPIPGTPLFETSCREYGVNPDEPLLHNNSILATLDKRVSFETFQRFKDKIQQLNRVLK